MKLPEEDFDMTEEGQARYPQPGSRWRHRPSGRCYTVLMMANTLADRKNDYPATVVYQDDLGIQWCRPYSRWHGSMEATL
jgi:hypothetical protein